MITSRMTDEEIALQFTKEMSVLKDVYEPEVFMAAANKLKHNKKDFSRYLKSNVAVNRRTYTTPLNNKYTFISFVCKHLGDSVVNSVIKGHLPYTSIIGVFVYTNYMDHLGRNHTVVLDLYGRVAFVITPHAISRYKQRHPDIRLNEGCKSVEEHFILNEFMLMGKEFGYNGSFLTATQINALVNKYSFLKEDNVYGLTSSDDNILFMNTNSGLAVIKQTLTSPMRYVVFKTYIDDGFINRNKQGIKCLNQFQYDKNQKCITPMGLTDFINTYKFGK